MRGRAHWRLAPRTAPAPSAVRLAPAHVRWSRRRSPRPAARLERMRPERPVRAQPVPVRVSHGQVSHGQVSRGPLDRVREQAEPLRRAVRAGPRKGAAAPRERPAPPPAGQWPVGRPVRRDWPVQPPGRQVPLQAAPDIRSFVVRPDMRLGLARMAAPAMPGRLGSGEPPTAPMVPWVLSIRSARAAQWAVRRAAVVPGLAVLRSQPGLVRRAGELDQARPGALAARWPQVAAAVVAAAVADGAFDRRPAGPGLRRLCGLRRKSGSPGLDRRWAEVEAPPAY